MPRPKLTKREYVVKVLDLIEHFGGGGPACRLLAEKWEVTRQTVYNWSSYNYPVEPNPPNKGKLLRLWYYHCCNHKGDRRTEKGQDESYALPSLSLSTIILKALNPVIGD
ncbi:hypothetical protein KAR91_44605 [Candidatus Pacearchaeota archaeon]|nr:hypothetical protein [Candidatus Pacearchaeota archaeon]